MLTVYESQHKDTDVSLSMCMCVCVCAQGSIVIGGDEEGQDPWEI